MIICEGCSQYFEPARRRNHSLTCSSRCKMRVHRRQQLDRLNGVSERAIKAESLLRRMTAVLEAGPDPAVVESLTCEARELIGSPA